MGRNLVGAGGIDSSLKKLAKVLCIEFRKNSRFQEGIDDLRYIRSGKRQSLRELLGELWGTNSFSLLWVSEHSVVMVENE